MRDANPPGPRRLRFSFFELQCQRAIAARTAIPDGCLTPASRRHSKTVPKRTGPSPASDPENAAQKNREQRRRPRSGPSYNANPSRLSTSFIEKNSMRDTFSNTVRQAPRASPALKGGRPPPAPSHNAARMGRSDGPRAGCAPGAPPRDANGHGRAAAASSSGRHPVGATRGADARPKGCRRPGEGRVRLTPASADAQCSRITVGASSGTGQAQAALGDEQRRGIKDR